MSLTSPLSQETSLVGRIVNSSVTASSLTIYASFEDKKTGVAREPQSTTRLFTLSKDLDTFEMILADSHTTTDGVTTITVNAAGRNLNKYGGLSGAATGNKHPINYEIGCADTHLPLEILNEIMRGNEGTGATTFRIGDETDSNMRIYAQNTDVNKPYIEFNAASNKWLISNDGSSTFDPEAGGSGVTAGAGIGLAAGVLSIDLTDTDKFVLTSSGAGDSGKAVILNASGEFNDGFVSSTIDFSTVTTTTAELNSLSGISANVTSTNLDILMAGPTSDADALHTHSNLAFSYTAYENVAADDALALIPIETEYFAQQTEVSNALGDNNARRKYAMKFTPSRTPNFTTMKIRGLKVASSTAILTVTIETDSSGPSGTPVTNGTASTIDTSAWSAAFADRTITWAAAPTMVAGTDYWLVISSSTTDPVNYVELGSADSYDENYLTFERQTYDFGAATWGASTSVAPLFFWTVSEKKSLGMAVVKADADVGGRCWSFLGFAKTTTTAGDSVDVYTDVVPDLSLDPGQDYYLSGTAGSISTDIIGGEYNGESTQFSYKIGTAISDTELKIELGEKRVWGTAGASATDVSELLFWFKPSRMNIKGGYLRSATEIVSTDGVDNITDKYCLVQDLDMAAAPAIGSETNYSFGYSVSDNYLGVASARTSAGVTYTVTKSGAPSGGFVLKWEAIA